MSQWKSKVNSLEKELRERRKELLKEYNKYNDIQQDILHAIEIEKYSAPQGAKLLKELKNLRIMRRDTDNELKEVEKILHRMYVGGLQNYNEAQKKYKYRTDEISSILNRSAGDYIKRNKE